MTRFHWPTMLRRSASGQRRVPPHARRKKQLTLEPLETRRLLSGDAWQPVISGRIVNGTPTSAYPSVGIIGDASGGFCSGTLIAPRFALTAGHCAEGVGNSAGRFTVGGQVYATSSVRVHPQYNNQTLANDIAIYELSQSVGGVTPSPIYRSTPQVGQMLTLVGFGAGGTGTGGHSGDFGTKRVGQTPIDAVEPTLILWRFDNNTEANTAPGDSGGPAFVTVNQVDFLAGVTSGGTRSDAAIGDESYDTRVDAYAAWIDSIVGTVTPPPPPPPPVDDDHANEPNGTATPVSLSASGEGSGQGTLESAGDRDLFQVTVPKTGTAVVSLTAANGSLDTYLRIYNSTGTLVAQNDDFGQTLNSQATVTVQPGTYYASAGSYQDAGTGAYQLAVRFTASDTTDKFTDAVSITLASDGTATAGSSIRSTNTSRMYSFVARYTGQMTVTTRATSGNLDTILTAYDASRRRITSNDDYGNSLNSRVQFNVIAGSKYFLEVTRYGSTTGSFSLTLRNTNSLRGRMESAGTSLGSPTSTQRTAPQRTAATSSMARPDSSVSLPVARNSQSLPVHPLRRAVRATDEVLAAHEHWLAGGIGIR